ncbi:MAG: hypothetical protein Crog4KO_35580 [Crocinitomicaceae bacterium]
MSTDYGKWNPQINHMLCVGCKQCVETCPTNALAQIDGRAQLVQPQNCIYCLACEDICPQEAIELPFLIITNNHHIQEKQNE